ncbi:UDP-galactose/UDP-glucose transporter 7-like [Actinia tenebrosa]|uniref:UDP-galactose/UDP-glucose transporter 7-like n=1 Tax=Actinia tenebrosa TaxID=6105 RepID=A0A6P8HJY8_ACTTE|nr:UDP-galactose/UDP-glucose transporter 7-like [Actinia tenebrosa]
MDETKEKQENKNESFLFDSSLFQDVQLTKVFAPGILAALFYGIVSGSMSFINKILLTSYGFHFPNVLMLIQVTVTSVILEVLRMVNVLNIPKYTMERAMKFAIPSVCFALQTALALKALTILSIPMYNILRRLLPIVTLVFTRLILKKTPSIVIVLAIIMVVSGCVIAGVGDLKFSTDAYICALASVFCQAFYLTFIQKTNVEEGLSTIAVLHLNSINCIPIMFVYVIMTREIQQTTSFAGYKSAGFEIILIVDVLMGCVLNYSLFLCATMNSALTTSLVGVVKGVLTTFIGFFTFGGVPATFLTITGIALNTLGSVLYTYGKYLENIEKQIHKHVHEQSIEIHEDPKVANGMVVINGSTDNPELKTIKVQS